jgi:hypothetical protein
MDIKIVCLSKGRHACISTKQVVDIDYIVCPLNEVEKYKEYNPKIEIIAQPKEVDNIVKARQFVLDNFENVFMIDDDVKFVTRFFNTADEVAKVEGKQAVKDIIIQVAMMAEEMGAKMYGFTCQRQPLAYHPQNPFRLTGYLNASHCGFLKDHNLKYDLRYLEGEDHFISLYNIFVNRFMLIDNRYGFVTEANFGKNGGCSDYRTTQGMQETTLMLREAFGEAIALKGVSQLKQNVREGERTLNMPF